MTKVQAGRFSANHDGPLVVFLIGMRINHFHKPAKWLPVIRAMGPMLNELHRDAESGFLGAETLFQPWRTVLLVQYWRDFDSLERYARARERQHWPAWTAFNRAVGNDGTVGIYHETYSVPHHGLETIYANMVPFGLGKVAGIVPSTGSRKTARTRMTGQADETAP
eukprot:gene12117-12202_t